MEERLITEEEYRDALRRFILIISEEENCCGEEFTQLIRMLEIYEYENC